MLFASGWLTMAERRGQGRGADIPRSETERKRKKKRTKCSVRDCLPVADARGVILAATAPAYGVLCGNAMRDTGFVRVSLRAASEETAPAEALR
jgi:hypothetical protein